MEVRRELSQKESESCELRMENASLSSSIQASNSSTAKLKKDLEGRIATLTTQLEATQQTNQRAVVSAAQIAASHQNALAKAGRSHESLQVEHANAVRNIQNSHVWAIANLSQSHSRQLTTMEKEHSSNMADFERSRVRVALVETQLRRLDADHEAGQRQLIKLRISVGQWFACTFGELSEHLWCDFIHKFTKYEMLAPLKDDDLAAGLWSVEAPWLGDSPGQPFSCAGQTYEQVAAQLFWLLHQDSWSGIDVSNAFEMLRAISDLVATSTDVVRTGRFRNLLDMVYSQFQKHLREDGYLSALAKFALRELHLALNTTPGSGWRSVDPSESPAGASLLGNLDLVLQQIKRDSEPSKVAEALQSRCLYPLHMIGTMGLYHQRGDRYWVVVDFQRRTVRVLEKGMGEMLADYSLVVRSPPDSKREDIVFPNTSVTTYLWWYERGLGMSEGRG